jgi:hypothetical protein
MAEKYHIFTVLVGGYGETPEEAWADAQENFDIWEEYQPITHKIDEDVEAPVADCELCRGLAPLNKKCFRHDGSLEAKGE